jgi:sulfur-oxidizing protein SoxX
MNKKTQLVLASLAATLLVAGCASGPSMVELNALTDKIVKASFRDQSHVKVERITATDETNRLCSEADVVGKPLDEKTAKRIEEANFKAIKWPSDGKFIGDWKEGEKIAQSGRGLTWTDKADDVNGGKIRGVSNPNDPASKAIVEYTWGKIWNAKAYNACSNMPRAGHTGILNEAQVRHIVGLLLDPKSPVNQ